MTSDRDQKLWLPNASLQASVMAHVDTISPLLWLARRSLSPHHGEPGWACFQQDDEQMVVSSAKANHDTWTNFPAVLNDDLTAAVVVAWALSPDVTWPSGEGKKCGVTVRTQKGVLGCSLVFTPFRGYWGK